MPTSRQAVYAEKAPKPNGNYSHVIRQGSILHVAGWMGDDPETGKIVSGGIEAQTVIHSLCCRSSVYWTDTDATFQERSIQNIKACLEAAGSSLDKVVRRRIYIIDMKQFRQVDEIWGNWFEEPYPVSTCVQVRAMIYVRFRA